MADSTIQGPSTRRFVLLEHRWDGVHWDLMVEDGDALRTWAIDRPIGTSGDLPARELPPHRRAYLDYEGPVSKGRGDVRRVDRGVVVVEGWSAGRVKLVARGTQLVGTIDLWSADDSGEPPRRWWVRLGKLS